MEVLFTLQEMLPNLGARRWMVVTITVELAMDHKPSHRELASVLISDLYQKVISQRDIGKGKKPSKYSTTFRLKVIRLFHIFSIWFLVEKLGRSCSWYSWCAHHFGQLYGQSYCRWLHSSQVYFVLQRPRWYRVGRQGLMSSRHLIKYETWIGKLISRKFGPLFENVTKCLWF